MRDDWLFAAGRRAAAAERLYDAATELIFRDGFDNFSIDVLAQKTHCSRATVYRYAGGKQDIREAVLTRAAARIVDKVRLAVDGRNGSDRVLVAIEVAVAEIRSDPAGQLFLDSMQDSTWITGSHAVTAFATELSGLAADDQPAAQWVARLVLSLLSWPGADPRAEHDMLRRFVAPAFDTPHNEK